MRKIPALIIGALALTACVRTTSPYQGNIRYTQNGADCIYEFSQTGSAYSKSFNEDKRIIHKETICRDLIIKDANVARASAEQPQAQPVAAPAPVAQQPVQPIIQQVIVPVPNAAAYQQQARVVRPGATPAEAKRFFSEAGTTIIVK